MTLNEWEQSNIEVLTSREMGEWLGRRENRLLDKIRAEIDEQKNYRCFDDDMCIYKAGLIDALEIIDKYRNEVSE